MINTRMSLSSDPRDARNIVLVKHPFVMTRVHVRADRRGGFSVQTTYYGEPSRYVEVATTAKNAREIAGVCIRRAVFNCAVSTALNNRYVWAKKRVEAVRDVLDAMNTLTCEPIFS